MFTVIALDIHGLFGLILAVAGVAMFGFGVWGLLPVRWRRAYVDAVRGPAKYTCQVCHMPTIDGSRYCSAEHQLQDDERKAW